MEGRLIERLNSRVTARYTLEKALTTIGRGRDNDIVVGGEFISHRHAVIHCDDRSHTLTDVSRNGTFLNGVRLTEPRPLHDGDVLTLPGQPDFSLVYEVQRVTATWSPVSAPQTEPAIRVDTATARVWVRGREVRVRPKEYLALALLVQRGGALVTKEELAACAWPEHGGMVSDDDITKLISGLRRRLEDGGAGPHDVLTVPRMGYRLNISS